MELNQYFFGLIVSMGALHLASVAGDYVRRSWNKRSHATNDRSSSTRERGDWYVFFHCADLLGREPKCPVRDDRPKQERPASAAISRQESNHSPRRRARV